MLTTQDKESIQRILDDWETNPEFSKYLLSSFAALFTSDNSMPIQNLRFMAWCKLDDRLCEVTVCSHVYSMSFNDFRFAYKPGIHENPALVLMCPLWNLSNAPECVQKLLDIYERVKTNEWAHNDQLEEPPKNMMKGSLIVE